MYKILIALCMSSYAICSAPEKQNFDFTLSQKEEKSQDLLSVAITLNNNKNGEETRRTNRFIIEKEEQKKVTVSWRGVNDFYCLDKENKAYMTKLLDLACQKYLGHGIEDNPDPNKKNCVFQFNATDFSQELSDVPNNYSKQDKTTCVIQ